MKTAKTIHLGYEISTGAPIEIPIRHMAVTGQTQEAGKTTALDAMITRSKLRAVAFITKRGEGAFQSSAAVEPFFQERADWEYVKSLLEATYRQRMKFEESWIMRACEGATTLSDVQRQAARLQDQAKGAFNQDMFMKLGKYLEKVVPLITRLPKSSRLKLRAGLNVMNLVAFPVEMQMLVIASTIRFIHEHEDNVIIIVPEAWQTIPQGRNTPVKYEVEKIARLGAGLKNYLWIDSQDMASVDKTILRACPVALIGVQREHNEVTRTLKQLEVAAKPKPRDVMTLKLGQFFACFEETVKRVYVQPPWLNESQARAIARGEKTIADFHELKPQVKREEQTSMATGKESDAHVISFDGLAEHLAGLSGQVERLNRNLEQINRASRPAPSSADAAGAAPAVDVDLIVERVIESLDVDTLAERVRERLPSLTPNKGVPVNVDEIVSRVLAHIPSSGVVKIEPKDVVLKRFQQAEVERILARAASLSHWQKQVLSFVEAKGAGVEKVDLLRLILGKKSANLVSDYKEKYREADELASLGFLRKDSKGRLYPNLAESMEDRLSEFNASAKEIEDVIGQVLLRLK